MALLVQLVIGQLQLVEVDDCIHPVCSRVRGVWVDVETCWGALLLEAANPGRVLVLVAVLVDWGHVHEEDVSGVRVKVKQFHFQWWEHPSKEGHVKSESIKLMYDYVYHYYMSGYFL